MGKKRIWDIKKIPDPQHRRNVRNIHNSLLPLPVTNSVSMLTHKYTTHLCSSEADRVAVLVQELLGVLGRLPDDLLVLGPEGLVHLVHRLKAVPAVYEHRAWDTNEKGSKLRTSSGTYISIMIKLISINGHRLNMELDLQSLF